MTASADRTELLQLHDWDELLFGGFYCLHCTPDDEDPLDDPIAWPCQPLREAGITDDEARALIEAHREKAAAEYEAKKRAEQAELRRRVDQFNAAYPVGTPVFAYPGARPEGIPSATRLVTRTRTKAQMSASGGDVVWVEGEGAYICLDHVDVVTETEWEAARAADAEAAKAKAAEDAKDRRRRIYIDGKGDGWIDLAVDTESGERELTGITNPWKIATADEVRSDTGSLREIGRCW